MTFPAIELTDVWKRYPNTKDTLPVLRGVSLVVEFGESVAIMGLSGSGKSTILKVAALLERPTSGSIRIAGNDVTNLRDRNCARLRSQFIGYIFQEPRLIERASATSNVGLAFDYTPRGVRRGRALAARRALADVGLSSVAARRVSQMSGGERQRVSIARAVSKGSQLILADEPTSALDGGSSAAVLEILLSVPQRSGGSLVLVTHDERVASLADRVYVLTNGVLGIGP